MLHNYNEFSSVKIGIKSTKNICERNIYLMNVINLFKLILFLLKWLRELLAVQAASLSLQILRLPVLMAAAAILTRLSSCASFLSSSGWIQFESW